MAGLRDKFTYEEILKAQIIFVILSFAVSWFVTKPFKTFKSPGHILEQATSPAETSKRLANMKSYQRTVTFWQIFYFASFGVLFLTCLAYRHRRDTTARYANAVGLAAVLPPLGWLIFANGKLAEFRAIGFGKSEPMIFPWAILLAIALVMVVYLVLLLHPRAKEFDR